MVRHAAVFGNQFRENVCVCCSVLQCAFQCVAVFGSLSWSPFEDKRLSEEVCVCVAVWCCCSVVHCVAVCCCVLRCVLQSPFENARESEEACVCIVLQCVAVCCSVLHCVAVCCSVLQYVAVCVAVTIWAEDRIKGGVGRGI